MIKVNVSKDLKNITIKGHAGYDVAGKDIVCAAVSSIVTTTINACIKLDNNSLNYQENEGLVVINLLSQNETTIKLIENMINMLEELAIEYKKNINIIKED